MKKEACGQNVYKFVKKYLDKASDGYIQRLFRKKEIRINNIKSAKDVILSEGDEVRIYIKDDTFSELHTKRVDNKAQKSLDILFENEDVLFIDKPEGMLTQGDRTGDFSVNDFLLSYIGCSPGFTPSTCNRLDRNTSGLVVAGKTIKGLQVLSEILSKGYVKKIYLTIVRGEVLDEIDDIAYLSRDNYNISHIDYDGVGKKIRTIVTPLEQLSGHTLVRVEIFGGRTHQIRAHLSTLGYPIYGDRKYGYKAGKGKHLLHCHKLHFDCGLELGLSNLEAIANIPSRFEEVCRRLRSGNVGN